MTALSGKYVLAFSGGIDSRVLAAAAAMCKVDFIACTLKGLHLTSFETEQAVNWCSGQGIAHTFLSFDPLRIEKIRANGPERCYWCKKEMLFRLQGFSRGLMDGSNADDLVSSRPGLSALQEAGVQSPLARAGLGKKDIRCLARDMGLENPEQPSRSCLLTRIAPGTEIREKTLAAVRYCEQIFLVSGLNDFRVFVFPKKVIVLVRETEKDVFSGLKQRLCALVKEHLQKPVETIITERVSGFLQSRIRKNI
ncbi:MAG: PP-loop family protein [Desulfonatronovibrionaceae bacterium]